MMENKIILGKSEYDALMERVFKYNYLVKLILRNSYMENKCFHTKYGITTSLEDFLISWESYTLEEWKEQQPKEEE